MHYLISGYYGEGNIGDEAILAGIIQEVRRRDPDARFTVLSFDPADTRRRHGVTALPTSLRDPGVIVQAMAGADILLSGGGSFLHEADFALYGRSFWFREGKLRPVPYFLAVILLGRAVGLPVMWYAQGLGPLHTAAARRLVGLAGSICPAVTWRDADSALLGSEVGVSAPVQLVVSDPAYALDPLSREAVDRLLSSHGLDPGVPYLAVSIRPWLGRTSYQERIASALARFLQEERSVEGWHLLLLPFQRRTDAGLAEALAADARLAGRADILELDDPAALAGALGRARLALTMRLHSGILAAAAGTPAVVVDYDPKVRAFARQTRQEAWCLAVEELETPRGEEALLRAALTTVATLPRRRAALRRAVAPLQTEAGRTAELAVRLAAAGGVPGLTPARRLFWTSRRPWAPRPEPQRAEW